MKPESKPLKKISFIIAAYNEESYISQCLQSIIDYSGIYETEIIVVDDQSTDTTQAEIKKLSGRYPEIIFPYNWWPQGSLQVTIKLSADPIR